MRNGTERDTLRLKMNLISESLDDLDSLPEWTKYQAARYENLISQYEELENELRLLQSEGH